MYQRTSIRQPFFVAFWLIAMAISIAFSCESHGQDVVQLPERDFDNLLEFDSEPIPENERPKQPNLNLPESLDQVPIPVTDDERKELSTWVRWLVLKNLPPSFEDNKKWGKEKEVFNGIRLRREGWRVETKRKKKTVKQGFWSRYFIEFVEPANQLQVNIRKIEFPTQGPIHVETQIIAPLKLFGRVSEWQRDVQLISVSTNADATVELNVTCDIQVLVNPLKFPPDVEFRPVVTDASIVLQEFKVHSISQIHGPAAELLGKGIREVLDHRLEDYSDKLVVKMNAEIAKQQGKLKLSAQDWLQTTMRKKTVAH